MKGNLDFGTATVANVKAVKQIWNKGKARVEPDARYAKIGEIEADREAEIFVVVPVRTKNTTNNLEHWTKTSKRRKAEHGAVEDMLIEHGGKRAVLLTGCVVTLTRISRGKLDDDGLRTAVKAIRDAVACWLLGGTHGQNDDDERIEWRYEQKSLGTGIHGVMISIRRRS